MLPSIPEKNEDETETEEEETRHKVGVETEESSQESQDISESEAEKRKGTFLEQYLLNWLCQHGSTNLGFSVYHLSYLPVFSDFLHAFLFRYLSFFPRMQ